MVAADADHNGKVSVQDIIAFRRVILGLTSEFPGNTVWRFIPAELRFENPENAITEALPEVLNFNDGLAGGVSRNFVAVKIGDVNASAKLEDLLDSPELDTRTLEPTLELVVSDRMLRAGEEYRIPVGVKNAQQVIGFQFGLQFDPAAVSLLQPENFYLTDLTKNNVGRFEETAQLTLSWSQRNVENLQDQQEILELRIRPTRDGRLSDFLWLDDQILEPEAYTPDYQTTGVSLHFESESPTGTTLVIGQNYPNPFAGITRIPFNLPENETVNLRIIDNHGRVLYQATSDFNAGKHEWIVENQNWPAGVLYYQMSTSGTTVTRRMILN
jgi:hypothetical protein